MGTWDHGLLDNDCACDGLSELVQGIVGDIEVLAGLASTPARAAKLASVVGVLLQLSAYSFDPGNADAKTIVAAVKAHAKGVVSLEAPARRILAKIAAGEGHALAERPAKLAKTRAALLHVGSTRAPFGKHEPALFASRQGAAYVQEVARRCVEMIDEDFEDESSWSDLCREGVGMGALAALMVLEPCTVAPRKLLAWQRKARAGLATLAAEPDEELPFHRTYHANLERVFAVLLRRFAAT